jgi:hypothetical protein
MRSWCPSVRFGASTPACGRPAGVRGVLTPRVQHREDSRKVV